MNIGSLGSHLVGYHLCGLVVAQQASLVTCGGLRINERWKRKRAVSVSSVKNEP